MSDEKSKDPIEVQSLDCAGGGCCPDVVINADRTITLTEGVFAMTMQKASCEKLARILAKHGYLKLR